MKKTLLIAICIASFFTACGSVEPIEKETKTISPDPFLTILENHKFSIDQTQSTEIKITRNSPEKISLTIKEDGLMDDSIQSAEYEMVLIKENGEWKVIRNVLMVDDCRRGTDENGKCL